MPLFHYTITEPSFSSSSASPQQTQLNSQQLDDDFSNFTDLQSDELLKLEQELKDHIISETEFKKLKNDLHRTIHDHSVACEISRMPDDEWEEWGDDFEQPFGEGTSEGVNNEIFRVYFKSVVEDLPSGIVLGGIGVAICDSRDNLLFELRKPLVGNGASRRCSEIKALIEGLNAAIELELKRVVFYCDYNPVFQLVTGKWPAKQRKVSALVNQVALLRKKFTYCQPSLAARNDIKFAFKFAREAIVSQVNKPAESSGSRSSHETCVICLEDTNIDQIFLINDCMHRYCFSCMKQHVEVKLLHGMLPKCPHEGCNTELKIDTCSKFLTPRLIEIMSQRIKEASIPVTEKVYCPYPKCSALMSKGEVLEHSKSARVGAEICGHRKCVKCNGHFCINCKVPWHHNMTCFDYKRINPYPQPEEAKLKKLAVTNLWRQCVKCNHMIELAAGCYHMTCRCGHEFCYTCGSEWKNKEATCSCPRWDEEYILDDDDDDDEDEDEDDDEDEDEYYYSSEEDYVL
ncbi:zinc finger (C3HC4-type RING finger) family protein [Forsythia ovata]|uniref:RBR-type E3 ubiquitin transferase n=1 Tax=Forsythia ovata TaxID=205694 RepID=A0ABD1RKG3_9LAMI